MLSSVRNFLTKSVQDQRLLHTHICLLTAICIEGYHTKAGLKFETSRSRLMKLSGIKGKGSYHRILNQLIDFKLIDYQPSYHPQKASSISLVK